MLEEIKILQGTKELIVKVGRRRKAGKRYPCGQRVQEKALTPAQVAATMPHRQHLPADKRHDQKAASPFGGLNLVGAISDIQFDAGDRFRKTVARYREVIDSPRDRPSVLASQYVAPPNEETIPIPCRLRIPMTDAEALERREAYSDAIAAITGHRQRVVVNSVVIWDKELQSGDLSFLRTGLDDLAGYYGLTRPSKSSLRK